jgi:hypothetical protein
MNQRQSPVSTSKLSDLAVFHALNDSRATTARFIFAPESS